MFKLVHLLLKCPSNCIQINLKLQNINYIASKIKLKLLNVKVGTPVLKNSFNLYSTVTLLLRNESKTIKYNFIASEIKFKLFKIKIGTPVFKISFNMYSTITLLHRN